MAIVNLPELTLDLSCHINHNRAVLNRRRSGFATAREFDLTKPVPAYSKETGFGYEPDFALA